MTRRGYRAGRARRDLSDNDLSGTIPSSFSALTNMFSLELQENNLTGAVDPLRNLTSLNKL